MGTEDDVPRQSLPLDGVERRNPDAPVTRADLSTLAASVQRQMSVGDMRMSALESQLKFNTSMTAETKKMLEDVQFGLKVISFLGRAVVWMGHISAAVAAIYGVYYLVVHGPQQPKP